MQQGLQHSVFELACPVLIVHSGQRWLLVASDLVQVNASVIKAFRPLLLHTLSVLAPLSCTFKPTLHQQPMYRYSMALCLRHVL